MDSSKARQSDDTPSSIPLIHYPESSLTENEGVGEQDAFLRSSVAWATQNPRDSETSSGDKVFDSHDQPSTKLFRSWFVMLLVLLYACLAIFAWVITCILTFRPISGPKQFGVRYDPESGYVDGWEFADALHGQYVKSEDWYRAARVIQSIVGVLTIPLTSAVCSSAAVIFVQQHRSTSGLTIRQVMTLADRGWVGPTTFGRAVTSWKRYGSSFLLVAIFLTLLGGLLDIPDQFRDDGDSGIPGHDVNLVTIITRNSLLSASNVEPQPQLWQGAGSACENMMNIPALILKQGSVPAACGKGVTFGNMSLLESPFLAELPSGYNTGLIRQFIPRFNSTAKYENISAVDYPNGCDQLPHAFYVEYSYVDEPNSSEPAGWNIEVCMPADLRTSPWKSTRDRQDFSEVLYLNLSMYGGISSSPTPDGGSLFRITLNTTAGYFELPNYMNGQGSAQEPNSTQIFSSSEDSSSKHSKRDSNSGDGFIFNNNQTNSTIVPETLINKGPLLTTALALFGNGSFLSDRVAYPEAYRGINKTELPYAPHYSPFNTGTCMDLVPMGRLFATPDGSQTSMEGYTDSCIRNIDAQGTSSGVGSILAGWLSNFQDDTTHLSNVFTTAAYLANQAWVTNNGELGHSLIINFDYGTDIEVPTISRAGIILISSLLALYLLSIFILAVYASLSPRWTYQLDAFAMMKIGAASRTKSLCWLERERVGSACWTKLQAGLEMLQKSMRRLDGWDWEHRND
ncbi:hypothetical protein EG329_003324 [Mollisiaceae sp. DMI_Dod_QoI]|nr:hypothetical protein EG329_003324 [Helotiales sp. DMI_Dod_QoI]